MAENGFAQDIQDVIALKNLLNLQPNYIIMMQPWNALFMQHWMK